jgi:ribonuclease R
MNNNYQDKQLGQYILQNLLPKAYYDICDIGHYGLGLNNYTHWTSPIRRSCDLINHYLIKGYDIDISKYIKFMNDSEIIQDSVQKFILYYIWCLFKRVKTIYCI